MLLLSNLVIVVPEQQYQYYLIHIKHSMKFSRGTNFAVQQGRNLMINKLMKLHFDECSMKIECQQNRARHLMDSMEKSSIMNRVYSSWQGRLIDSSSRVIQTAAALSDTKQLSSHESLMNTTKVSKMDGKLFIIMKRRQHQKGKLEAL
jgi:hypothetical protein